jgi:hypothetical protein
MIEKYYSCKLLADVVLNSSLATEGNMQSLDYIAGSNFYGIVAGAIYNDNTIPNEEKKRLLHSNAVSFGDASISDGQDLFYSMPYVYFKEKDNEQAKIMLHHQIVGNAKYDGIQFKQERNGFLNSKGKYIKKVKKNFQLKSAYDRKNRTSDDGKMFGFEAIESGQIFTFTVVYQNESDIGLIEAKLLGDDKFIGKSKTAQYGRVKIASEENINKIPSFNNPTFALVYVESHLCFFDTDGLPTFKPTIDQLGFESGEINWEKSQIRTFVYSPWNGKRQTNTMQRNCIAKGSVFYIEDPKRSENTPRSVGEYINEGLGRILINPVFLENEGDALKIRLEPIKNSEENTIPKSTSNSLLFKRLEYTKQKKQNDIAIAAKVNKILAELEKNKSSLLKISSSQWGAIRAFATKAKNFEDFYKKLFEVNTGYLEKGVAYDRYWSKNDNINKLKKIINNQDLTYIIKLVSEITKKINSKDKNANP